jgi:hypothetical protein
MINYQGYNLPEDAATPVTYTVDQTNNPGLVVIGGTTGSIATSLQLAIASPGGGVPIANQAVILPGDCAIGITWEKVLAVSGIIDGEDVIEHIRRKCCAIEFSFTLLSPNPNGGGYIFPQNDFKTLLNNVFLPNKVQSVQNTWLNSQGISQIVIHKMVPTPVKGSTKMMVRIVSIENIVGLPLTIAS